jgi:hypothetical protein
VSFDYSKVSATASRLIASFGAAITIKSPVKSGDDWQPTVTYSESAAIGVRLNYSGRDLINSSVEIGDSQFLIAGTSNVSIGDSIVDCDNREWHVVNVKTINPAGTPVMHSAQARR